MGRDKEHGAETCGMAFMMGFDEKREGVSSGPHLDKYKVCASNHCMMPMPSSGKMS